MRNNDNGLQGRWGSMPVNDDSDDDNYHIGQITLSIGHYHYLIKIIPPNKTPRWSRLVTIDELCEAKTVFFDDEQELLTWLTWVRKLDDGRPRVVAMR